MGWVGGGGVRSLVEVERGSGRERFAVPRERVEEARRGGVRFAARTGVGLGCSGADGALGWARRAAGQGAGLVWPAGARVRGTEPSFGWGIVGIAGADG